mgnify:CR=1 FL=1
MPLIFFKIYTDIVETLVWATPHTLIDGVGLNFHRRYILICSCARSKAFFSGQVLQDHCPLIVFNYRHIVENCVSTTPPIDIKGL